MVFDLRGALLKKEEVESARLADFEFRHRVRTMRLLAPLLGLDADALARESARRPHALILEDLAERSGLEVADIVARHDACRREAHAQLVIERGDPSPHRLA